MRICGGRTGRTLKSMAALMEVCHCYTTGSLACSAPEGLAEGLVCDADISGVGRPAAFLASYLKGCSRSDDITTAVKKIHETVRGGYACAWESEGALYLFRDPVGIKPLYYQGPLFASEKKALSASCTLLRPGEVVKLPGMILHRTEIEGVTTREPEQILDSLKTSVHLNLEKDAAILFSGGIDSALLAALSENPVISCGLEGSEDIIFSRKAARMLEKELVEVVVTEPHIEEAAYTVLSLIEEKTLLNLELGLLTFLVCQQWNGRMLISGQGADELFGGYHKYEKAFYQEKNVKKIMREDFEEIHLGLERDGIIAERFDKILRYPYLYLPLVKEALGIPAEYLFVSQRKQILRNVAELLSLPEEIVSRPKKALQYGSGIHKVVKNMRLKLKKISKRT